MNALKFGVGLSVQALVCVGQNRETLRARVSVVERKRVLLWSAFGGPTRAPSGLQCQPALFIRGSIEEHAAWFDSST